MKRWAAGLGLLAALLLLPGPAFAQAGDDEPTAILVIGGAGEWSLKDGGSSVGPSLAVETTAIEDWLEIEAGVTPFFSHGQTEWDTDFLFEKPFTLSESVEFMAGLGPEWVHVSGHGSTRDSVGGEVAAELTIWPWAGRKIGWYVEPAYGYDFGRGHEQSLSTTVGILIAIP